MTDERALNPHLLAVAHGTANPAGLSANEHLIERVRALRPEISVTLCWLDIASPSLAGALAQLTGPVVVVPVLLCTGYHVKTDIPAEIAGREATVQAGHLGPDQRVVTAVAQRLKEAGGAGRPVVLVGSGSSDPEARIELQRAAGLLAGLTGSEVTVAQLSEDDPLAGAGPETEVASYLLATGYFAQRLQRLAGSRTVSEPIGAHPLIADVILDRYDAATRQLLGDFRVDANG
jgi:sirohydrochlorin ferrochelatase